LLIASFFHTETRSVSSGPIRYSSTGSALAAFGARLLRPLGSCSPFPHPVRFQNRADLVLASLQLAQIVLAPSGDGGDLLVAAGLAARAIETAGADDMLGERVAAAILAVGAGAETARDKG